MSEVTFREYTPADAEDLLGIRNAIFPPLTLEQWRKLEPTNTAAMAYIGDEPVGAIPLELRPFQVAPGAVIDTAFEHAVGTREDMRSRGIGSGMIAAAREFLQDRAEMLMVYRGAERSRGYRFYEKTGHVDLIYLRIATWKPEQLPAGDCTLGGVDELHADSEGILSVFTAMFGDYGGFPYRDGPGYWALAMRRGIYMVIPQNTHYIRYPAAGPLQAYMIVGEKTGDRADQPLQVEDAAATGPDALQHCLRTLANLAVERAKPVSWLLSSEHPCREVALDAGFQPDLRYTMIMGQVLTPQRLFGKVCTDLGLVADLKINVWTPTRDYTLYEGPEARTEVTIEAKDWAIHRLLCRRLDFASAVNGDIVSMLNATPDIIERISNVLPYNLWAYPTIDYT